MLHRKWKQMGAWLLAFSMVLGSAQLPAMGVKAAEAEGGYKEELGAKANPIPPVAVTGVEVTGVPEKALKPGEKAHVQVWVLPEEAENKRVTWTSDKPEVATVEEGNITAISEGEAKITVTTEDGGYMAEFTVEVKYPKQCSIPGISLSGVPEKAMEIGETVTVVAALMPWGIKDLIWTSNNPAVAKVQNGVITAVAEGEAVITVSTRDGEFASTRTFTVKVNAKPVTEKPEPEKPGVIKEGDKTEDRNGCYEVTSGTKKTAELLKAKNKKKANIKVPLTVRVNHVKCKVVKIGDQAFKGFKNLRKITLNENIITIGKQAFAGCKNLKTIVIKGTKLKTIQAGAFKNTSSEITIKFAGKKLTAKRKAALLKKLRKAGLSKNVKIKWD